MGSFYGNASVLGVLLDDVRRVAPTPAFAAVEGDDVVLFAQADDEGSPMTGAHLSAALGCLVFGAGVHDDDIFFFEVHDQGNPLLSGAIPDPSEYFDLDPDEHDELAMPSVDAPALVAALGRGDVDAARAALSDDFAFATERHAALVEALELPRAAVGWGYNSLTREPRGDSAPAVASL